MEGKLKETQLPLYAQYYLVSYHNEIDFFSLLN